MKQRLRAPSEEMTHPKATFRWPHFAASSSQAVVEGAPPDQTAATIARRAIVPLSMRDRIVVIVAPVGCGKMPLTRAVALQCLAHEHGQRNRGRV